MSAAPEKKAFKDWFDAEAAQRLGRQIQAVWPAFPLARFQRQALRGLAALEFHGRVQQFSEALAACLPDAVPEALDLLTRSLPPVTPEQAPMNDGWLQWPLGQLIADHGGAHFEASFQAMVELTQRFSSEFAVRPFVEQQPEKTFAALRGLTDHPSPHVRRWCSEGLRPRLPWGKRLDALVADPGPIWPILEALKDDPSPYVRTSVANCLNDIAKDHPEAVLVRCECWQKQAGPGRQWILRHALRSLIKAGHPRALALMGYATDPAVKAVLTLTPTRCRIGETVVLEAELTNTGKSAQPLLLDIHVAFTGKTRGLRGKVFKWTSLTLAPGETRRLRKTLSCFRPTTVRALYPGEHSVQLQINGSRQGKALLRLEQA